MRRKSALAFLVAMLVTAAIALASPRIAVAQDNNTDNATHMVTGCLRQGASSGLYRLTDENGKMWNLRSKMIRMNQHVGQTVTATGTTPPEPNDSADTAPQNNLLVTKLDTARNDCKQP